MNPSNNNNEENRYQRPVLHLVPIEGSSRAFYPTLQGDKEDIRKYLEEVRAMKERYDKRKREKDEKKESEKKEREKNESQKIESEKIEGENNESSMIIEGEVCNNNYEGIASKPSKSSRVYDSIIVPRDYNITLLRKIIDEEMTKRANSQVNVSEKKEA